MIQMAEKNKVKELTNAEIIGSMTTFELVHYAHIFSMAVENRLTGKGKYKEYTG